MRNSFLKKFFWVIAALVFALASSNAPAETKQWFIIKDKNGVCSVRSLKAKTEKTIAGPYATKDEAMKAKTEKCPKSNKK